MAHHPQGQHWRDLGKSKSLDLPDKSTAEILGKLSTPQPRHPVTSHEGVASVGADGIKPTKHDCPKSEANAAFNDAASKPPRMTTRPDQITAAGLTGPAKYGR